MALYGAFRASRALCAAAVGKAAPKPTMEAINLKDLDTWIDWWSWKPEVRSELLKFKNHLRDTVTRMEARFIKEPFTIDWERYRKTLPPHVVNFYKEVYDSIEVPVYKDEGLDEVKKKFADLEKLAAEADKEFLVVLEEDEKEEEKARKFMERLPTMTVDEVIAERPDLKEKVDAEIRAYNWDYSLSPFGTRK